MKRWVALFLSVCFLFTGCHINTLSTNTIGYLLIDAGHGGFDGGAVALDGTCEKRINLEISLCLRDLMMVLGVPVLMTRENDAALADTKTEDMHRRLALYEGANAVISIHQNFFSVSRYNGTQSFYSKNNPNAQLLADSVQDVVRRFVQPSNNRPVKQAPDGVFLMNHTAVPAVLIECGFLSNSDELSLLKRADYQQTLAFAIMCGYWNYQHQK